MYFNRFNLKSLGKLSNQLSMDGRQAGELETILSSMFEFFRAKDASLIEINPLAITRQGEVLALDAVLSFDDNALFRHPDISGLHPSMVWVDR